MNEDLLNTDSCDQGLSWISHYGYIAFIFISAIFEGYLYKNMIDRVGHLMPSLELSAISFKYWE